MEQVSPDYRPGIDRVSHRREEKTACDKRVGRAEAGEVAPAIAPSSHGSASAPDNRARRSCAFHSKFAPAPSATPFSAPRRPLYCRLLLCGAPRFVSAPRPRTPLATIFLFHLLPVHCSHAHCNDCNAFPSFCHFPIAAAFALLKIFWIHVGAAFVASDPVSTMATAMAMSAWCVLLHPGDVNLYYFSNASFEEFCEVGS